MINYNNIKLRISRLRKNSLAANTLWVFLAQSINIFIQAACFVIITRALGIKQYGAFVSVIALNQIFAPFVGLGSGFILLKKVSRNLSSFAVYWGNALFIILVSALVLNTFILLTFPAFLNSNIPFLVILFAIISDLIFAIILNTAIQVFQAINKLNVVAQLQVLTCITKLMAALCLVSFFPQQGIITWACLYMISKIFATVIAFILVQYHLGPPRLDIELLKSELVQGFYFSVSNSSRNIYGHIDKTMLARLSTLEATGVYAAAYRLISVAFIPLSSLLFSSYPIFFKQGAKGIRTSVSFVKKLLPLAMVYGLAIGVAILLFASIVPYILGEEYASAIEVLRWLALLPLLKSLNMFAGNTLTGADLQGFRSAMQVSTAFFNFMINLWLIPLYSWKGAAWSTLASESLLGMGCWGIVAWYYWHQGRGGEV
ncbi:MAG: oligosaccharide flippase family protein [Xenococcus sp. MO_188.B8]|nr:oligosaccharide flippase family protein [Xenococcus sp. MO_188.B8]